MHSNRTSFSGRMTRAAFTFGVLLLLTTATAYPASHGDRGWQAYFRNDIEAASRHFTRGLRGGKETSPCLAGLAWIDRTKGRYADAFEAFLEAARFAPEKPGAEFFLRSAESLSGYARETGKFASACREIAETSSDPDTAALARWYEMTAQARLGNVSEAMALSRSLSFLERFTLCGPYDNHEETGFSEVYYPETEWNPVGAYPGKGRNVGWRPMPVPSTWGRVNLASFCQPSQNATAYAVTFLNSDSEKDIQIRLGHAGAVKVWLNGDLVIAEDSYHPLGFDQVMAPARLQAGVNTLLIKCCGKDNGWDFRIRLTDPSGAPLPVDEIHHTDSITQDVRWPNGADLEPVPKVQAFGDLADFTAMADEGKLPHWLQMVYALDLKSADRLDENDHRDIEILRALEKDYPNAGIVQNALARVEIAENAVRESLQKAAAAYPGDVNSREALARHYLEKDWREMSRTLLGGLLPDHPGMPGLWRLNARLLRAEGSEELVGASLLKAAELAPNLEDAWLSLADGPEYLTTLGRREEYLRKALEVRYTSQARSSLINALLRKGAVEDARIEIEIERQLDPAATSGLVKLAKYHQGAKDFIAARKWIGEALAINPDSAELNRMAGAIAHESGDTESALNHWRTALTTRPNDNTLREYYDFISPEGDDYYKPHRIDSGNLASPAALPEEANTYLLLDQKVIRVYPNGLSSHTVHRVIDILTETGAREESRQYVWYEPGRTRAQVLRARVTRGDGTAYDADPPREVSPSWNDAVASRIYGDYKGLAINLPGLEKGARVDLEYKVEEYGDNLYADYFGDLFFIGRYEPTALSEYILITPSGREFYTKLVTTGSHAGHIGNSSPELIASPDGDSVTRKWTFRDLPLVKRESMMPPASEVLPYLKVSTFKTWDDLGKWYWNLIKDQFVADQTVKEIADRLAREAAALAMDERGPGAEAGVTEKVRAVNRYVNSDIRYLGFEFGIHGYKPHRAAQVCRAQYGDCKDKATLAITLLHELGVPALFTLLRTRRLGEVDYDLPSLGLFNHAIFYIPGLDGGRWLDGTARFHGVNDLPSDDEGVNMLNQLGDGTVEFLRSPVSDAKDNTIRYAGALMISQDGTATGRIRQSFTGLYNPAIRNSYENRARMPEEMERTLGQYVTGARISDVTHSDLGNIDKPVWIEFGLTAPSLVTAQKNSLELRGHLIPSNLSRIYAPLTQRSHDLVINSFAWTRDTDLTITLSPGLSIESLPQETVIDEPFGRFELRVTREGDTLRVRHRLEYRPRRVKVDEYRAFRDFCRRVDLAEDARIHLKAVNP